MDRLTTLGFAIIAAVCPAAPVFARAMEPGDAAAVGRAAPAVVSIHTWQVIPPDQPGGPPQLIRAYGSGFIIDPSGIIVTNKHVIDGRDRHEGRLFSDGSEASARLLAASALVDLAVLKVDVDHPLPSVEWGDSDALQVGDPVLTIGNELDSGTSVSAGIVSGLNRNLMDSAVRQLHPDRRNDQSRQLGRATGRSGWQSGRRSIQRCTIPQSGGFIGIGFAIPASTAQYVVAKLIDPNRTEPGWLGFRLQDMTWDMAGDLGVPYHAGALVASVDPSGPASRALLQAGDVLINSTARTWVTRVRSCAPSPRQPSGSPCT